MASDGRATRYPPRFWARALVCVGSALAAFGACARADAQPIAEPSPEDKETARALMDKGHEHFKAKDFAGALAAYEAADRIMGVPTTALGVGRAHAELGHLLAAHEALLRAHMFPVHPNEPPAFARARERAKEIDDEVMARVASLRLTFEPADARASVKVDGKRVPEAALDLPRKLDPGEHTVRVRARGFSRFETRVTLTEGEARTLRVALQPGDDDGDDDDGGPSPLHPLWPLTVGGFALAGTGLLVGAITGGVALKRGRDLVARCPNNVCAPDEQGNIDATVALSNVSNAFFGIAGVGAVAGVIGLFVGPTAESDAAARDAVVVLDLALGPASLALGGNF